MTRPNLPLKLYYRIGEVAEIVGVETHVLRYWETEFPTIRPQKSPKGQRVYSRRDLEKLLRVKELLYSEGYTVQGARKRLRELMKERDPKANSETPAPPEVAASMAPAESASAPTSLPVLDDRFQVQSVLLNLRRQIRDELSALTARA